ncbi:MAG: hypothetical protein AMS26_23780 [Bacteroides sp. SM23_62]|nr:MAG: hypothetical protein AMS26_23780 [Bacteroides sp. SM23_62]
MYVHESNVRNAEEALIEFTNGGGSLIVLHHGIASAKMKNPEWLDFIGIELFPRDHHKYPWGVMGHTTHTMVNLNPGHFITTNGITYDKDIPFHSEYDTIFHDVYPAFDLTDSEIFINQRLNPNLDEVTYYIILMESFSISFWV